MNKYKGAGIILAVIDAAREVIKTGERCSTPNDCKKCAIASNCSTGKLYHALRKYDKLAKREARRG